jgi:hypothetical protein
MSTQAFGHYLQLKGSTTLKFQNYWVGENVTVDSINAVSGTTYIITETYSGTPVRGYLYVPTAGPSKLDVVVLMHGTIDNAGITPLRAAQRFLSIAQNPDGLNLNNRILFSVAYPQDSIPGWTQEQANSLFPGITLSTFYFGDNIAYVEAALLWAKNSINAYLTSQGTGKSRGKLFNFGHSQGAYLAHRLNRLHAVDGVICNAPGPIDLLVRCQTSEAQGNNNLTCLKLNTAFGSTVVSPTTYSNLSLSAFMSGTLSTALYTQAEDDPNPVQVQNMKTILQPGMEACNTCATSIFNYYARGGHDAFVINTKLQQDIREFINGGPLPGNTYSFLPFGFSGATVTRSGDNQPAILVFPNNALSRGWVETAVRQQWIATCQTLLIDPGNKTGGRVLASYTAQIVSGGWNETSVELRMASVLDAVGADLPRKRLTRQLVGKLPLTARVNLQ